MATGQVPPARPSLAGIAASFAAQSSGYPSQAILILFLYPLLLPYIAHWLTGALSWTAAWVAPTAVFALMTWAVTVGARNLKWLIDCEKHPERANAWLPPQEQFAVLWTIVAPMFFALWILTAWL